MPAIINFKICDNSDECGGLEVYPTKAITWNKTKKTLEINESKCIDCGLCTKECPVEAIQIATGDELEKIKKEEEKNENEISNLFIERYGATSIDPESLISGAFLQNQIEKKLTLVAEFFDPKTIMCLYKSIPIRDMFEKRILYYKINTEFNKDLVNKYKLSIFPCLLFFKNGQLTGKIEGYYGLDQKQEFIKQVFSLT